jgi:hypothetical protein
MEGSGETGVYMLASSENMDLLCGVERQEAAQNFVLDGIPSSTQCNFVESEGSPPHFHLGRWVTESYMSV